MNEKEAVVDQIKQEQHFKKLHEMPYAAKQKRSGHSFVDGD